METQSVRRATLRLQYQSTDISQDIGPDLTRFDYQDHAHGKADAVSVVIADRDKKWFGSWFPGKGDSLTAWIDVADWPEAGQKITLPCGQFTIDQVELSGPPDAVTIKAASASVRKTMRRQKRSARWEGVGLRQVAQDIANRHGLTLHWELTDDPIHKRIDQSEESDLALLRRLAEDAGGNVKVADGQLIIFSGRDYDSRPPSVTIERGVSELIDYRFSTQAHEVYKAATVRYWDPHMQMEVTETFSAPDAPASGQVLSIKAMAQDRAQAERLARSKLRIANKAEVAASLRLVGNPALAAGLTVAVKGFGGMDATYFVESVRHQLSGGGAYTTAVEARRVLAGY